MFKRIKKTERFAKIVAILIQKAFSGFPWYEILTKNECLNRILKDFKRNNFFGYILFVDNKPVAANWIDQLSIEQIKVERGENLANFVSSFGIDYILWERDILVDPYYQNKGYGTKIKKQLFGYLKHKYSGQYIFARLRQDNIGSIKICEKMGYKKTGILVPSSQIKGLFHEYYFLLL